MPGMKSTTRVAAIIACAWILGAVCAEAAQRAAAVTGTVLDPQGTPVADATVSLEDGPGAAVTDARGRFRIDVVPPGQYQLRATHIAYHAVTVPVEVTEDGPTQVAMKFTREALLPLDEVVVTATRTPTVLKEVPLPVEVITAEQIAAHHAETTADVLDHVTGVNLMPNGFTRSSVSIHGLPEEYVLVLVDGQRQYGRHADAKDLASIATDAIERIELVKGPSSVLYGSDAVAGIVNVITRQGRSRPALRVYGSTGSKDTHLLRGAMGGALLDWQHHLAGSWNASDYMGDGYGYRAYNLRLNSRRKLGENHQIEVRVGFFDEQTERMPATDDFAGGHYLDDETADFQVGWHWQGDEHSEWRVAGYYYGQHRVDARPGRDAREWDRGNVRFELQNTTKLRGHGLTTGLEARLERIDYTLVDGQKDQEILSLYVQDEWRVSEEVTAIAAARMEHHDRWGAVVVPRMGVAVRLTAATVVRASGGSSFRGPSLTDLYEEEYYHPWGGGFWLGGNPDLEPERSIGLNLDMEYLGDHAVLAGSLFYNRLTDRIAQEDTGAEIEGKTVRRLTNRDEALSWGMEVRARWLPRAGLRTGLGYTYLDTEDKSTGLDFDYAPSHTVDAQVSWEPGGRGLSVAVRGKLLGERYASASQGRELPRTYVLNLNLEKDVAPGLSAFVAADNVLAEQLYWESSYFEQGRELRAGLRYRL